MKVYLTSETEKLNLEHSYWLKDTFIDKIGRMSPNLRQLSLRRLRVSNKAFTEIMIHMKHLERVDISDCPNIYESGMKVLLSNNKNSLQQLQCSNTSGAITDNVIDLLVQVPNLTFLDISYSKQVTDDGMACFKDKTLPIKKLFVNGMTGISAVGLTELINSCK